MKDDEALQSMTDGMSESTEKIQPQASCSSAFPASPQANGYSEHDWQTFWGALTISKVGSLSQSLACLCWPPTQRHFNSSGTQSEVCRLRKKCPCLMQTVADAPETPDRHRRSLSQPLPRPYSPPIDHLGSSGQPWHELQEQASPRSDASDPWDDKMQQWHPDAVHKPHDKASN